jgi:phosphoserine phosphatase RsbU/P
MKKYNRLVIYSLISVISIVIICFLYPRYYPNNSINPKYDVNQIRRIAKDFFNEQKVDSKNFQLIIATGKKTNLIADVQKKLGLKKANELFSSKLPVYYWDVELATQEELTLSLGSKEAKVNGKLSGNTMVNYDFNGKLIEYDRKLADSVTPPKLTMDEAKQTALDFARKYSNVYSKIIKAASKDSVINQFRNENSQIGKGAYSYSFSVNKVVYQFSWEVPDPESSTNLNVKIAITGNTVSSFSASYTMASPEVEKDNGLFSDISQFLIYTIVFIMIGVLGYKKIRAYEIGYKLAFVIALISAATVSCYTMVQLGNYLRWVLLIPISSVFILWGGLVFMVWAVSEAVVRDAWPKKFRSFDILMKGHFLHSKIGENILTGLNAGIILFAAYLCMIAFFSAFCGNISIVPSDSAIKMLSCKVSFLYFLDSEIYHNIFYVIIFIAFLSTALSKKIAHKWIVVVLCGIVWGLINQCKIEPNYYSILIQFILGLAVFYVFYKYDIFTAIITLSVFAYMGETMRFFWSASPVFQQMQFIPLFMLAILITYSLVALFSKDQIEDYNTIVPEFEKHVTERQRLQKELEIAREVQMSFLPRVNPVVNGLDIASRCLPAMEVGGDYFDFIDFGENKLGVVIGDVSGKGTKAAFYMTLSKGFLKAIAKTSSSPSEVLTKMNNMFYENVDRGTFITMILGVFDLKENKFVFASAGHNPVIYKNNRVGKIETVNPKGMALGLEKGEIFSKTIEEYSISFLEGDAFIFYTDGFSEAMNSKREEYGEEKLNEILQNNSSLCSEEIMDAYFSTVKTFMGKALQHDDMSMVVVKIK